MKNETNPKNTIKKPRIIESVEVSSPVVKNSMETEKKNIVETLKKEEQQEITKNSIIRKDLKSKIENQLKKINLKNPKTLIIILVILVLVFFLFKMLTSLTTGAANNKKGEENKTNSADNTSIVYGAKPKTTIKIPTVPNFSKKTYQATVDGITWYYSLDENNNCLIRYTFSQLKEKVTLPAYIDNYPVIAVGQPNSTSGIFQTTMGLEEKNSDVIKTLTVSYGIKYIFDSAFSNLKSLEKVELPETITYLGNNVFAFDSNLKYLNSQDVGHVSLPASLEYYGTSLFRNCEKIESFTFPENISYIQKYTFYGCTGIKENLTIPSQYTLILDGAFSNVPNYDTLTLESGITYIGEKAFEENTSLNRVLLPTTITGMGSYAFSKDKNIREFIYTGKLSYLGKDPFGQTDRNIDDFIKPEQVIGFEN